MAIRLSLGALLLFLAGCTSAPKGIEPVEPFVLQRYLGTWYEIARLDHRFERGLQEISATYSLRDDGGIQVINRGYNPSSESWQSAEGRAYFAAGPERGHLKVSFFGPFYGAYVIFELDQRDYRYAFVSGPDRDYLWFLSRTPEVEPELLDNFIQRAKALGFDTDALIFPQQSAQAAQPPPP